MSTSSLYWCELAYSPPPPCLLPAAAEWWTGARWRSWPRCKGQTCKSRLRRSLPGWPAIALFRNRISDRPIQTYSVHRRAQCLTTTTLFSLYQSVALFFLFVFTGALVCDRVIDLGGGRSPSRLRRILNASIQQAPTLVPICTPTLAIIYKDNGTAP